MRKQFLQTKTALSRPFKFPPRYQMRKIPPLTSKQILSILTKEGFEMEKTLAERVLLLRFLFARTNLSPYWPWLFSCPFFILQREYNIYPNSCQYLLPKYFKSVYFSLKFSPP